MGLIKAAIILGAGGYALNKLTKSRDGHNCSCSHSRNGTRSQEIAQDPSDPNTNTQIPSWTPGRRIYGRPQSPEYKDEKSEWVAKDSGSEREGWVGDEKNGWVGVRRGGKEAAGGMTGPHGD